MSDEDRKKAELEYVQSRLAESELHLRQLLGTVGLTPEDITAEHKELLTREIVDKVRRADNPILAEKYRLAWDRLRQALQDQKGNSGDAFEDYERVSADVRAFMNWDREGGG